MGLRAWAYYVGCRVQYVGVWNSMLRIQALAVGGEGKRGSRGLRFRC